MSSAAKLRRFGRGTAVVATAALVLTAFGPTAFAWDDAPQTPSTVEATAGNNGTIGIVDTDTTVNDNQGATYVEPGKTGQSIGSVRLVIPNRFRSGDAIELRLFDRSATAKNNGTTNIGTDFLVGLSSDPTVAVSEVQNDDTRVTGDTDLNNGNTDPTGNKTQNTETTPANPWVAAGPAGSLTATKPTVTPSFRVQRLQSQAGQGYDILRLTHTTNPSNGDMDAKWVVTLSDLKVDLGSRVTPGALRMVPFAMNVNEAGTAFSNSDWFYGNRTPNTLVAADDSTAVGTRRIGIYTVPAYVSPVTINVASANIAADGSSQNVGDITIKEVHPVSIGDGTYTLTISGAEIVNPSTLTQFAVAVADGGTNERVTVTGATANTITFTVSGADNSRMSTYTLSGVQLRTTRSGPVTYSLNGATGTSLNSLLATAGTGGVAGSIPAEADFCAGVTALPIAGSATTVAVPMTATMTGTTELGNGTYTFAGATGATQVLENAAGTTVATTTNGLNWTLSSPYSGTLVLSGPAADTNTLTVAGRTATAPATTGRTVTPGGTTQLPNGTYTVFAQAGGGFELRAADGTTVVATTLATATGESIEGTVFTLSPPYVGTLTYEALVPADEAQDIEATDTIVIGATETITTNAANVPGSVTVTDASTTPLTAATTYYVVQDTTNNVWVINDTPDTTTPLATSTDGITFNRAGGGTVTLGAAVPTGSSFTMAAATTTDGVCVNQDDILFPWDDFVFRGTAGANLIAVGGNNRYETARKIAKEWSPLGDEVILASGQNYPDALSSGFLSQRLGAPIILTMKDSIPADTMESLRERGVRKVYIIGGPEAISQGVADRLMATPSYMWSDSAKNLVPRGGNLEVVRLGGSSRYSTNALVNMYAAAQYSTTAVIGTTSPGAGQANRTTAMLARGDSFPDALTANVLTSGRNTGDWVAVDGGGTVTYALTQAPTGVTLSAADMAKLGARTLYVRTDGTDLFLTTAATGTITADNTVATASATTTSASVFTLPGTAGTVAFNIPVSAGENITISSTTATGTYVPRLENINALPVILTPQGELGEQARSELTTLHVEHVLVIGGSNVIPDSVVTTIDGMDITTRRLGGTDRYDTARIVNEYAWTDAVASATVTDPGLGFDGGRRELNNVVYGEAEVFLANGLNYPDALVAGPWVSRRHDAMALVNPTLIPEATKKYLTDNADVLDRAIGLGLGAAVSSAVIVEANRLVAGR